MCVCVCVCVRVCVSVCGYRHIPRTIALSRGMTVAEIKSASAERICSVSIDRDQIGFVSLKPADEVLWRGKLFRVHLEGNHESKKFDVRVRAFR